LQRSEYPGARAKRHEKATFGPHGERIKFYKRVAARAGERKRGDE
jgi:hypothetical protein